MDVSVLDRDEVRAALRFEGPPRPPLAMSLWHNQETLAAHGDAFQELLRMYPDDTANTGMSVDYWRAPADDPTYRWAFGEKTEPSGVAIDAKVVIQDWNEEFEQFIAEFPDPYRPAATAGIEATRRANPDRYVLCGFGHYFHQRLAYLRGLQNLLFDFYDARDYLRRTMDALLAFYQVTAQRAAKAGANGIWGGDDLGTQRSLFMSPQVFREVYKPYYQQLGDIFHSNGLDFWLHTCGNITEIIPDLIECGVDALHPLQVGTMDDRQIAAEYGGKIAFWVGMDVQHLLPYGTPEEVRESVRQRMELFYRPEGGLILAAGNAIMADTPIENIRAYAETLRSPLR